MAAITMILLNNTISHYEYCITKLTFTGNDKEIFIKEITRALIEDTRGS